MVGNEKRPRAFKNDSILYGIQSFTNEPQLLEH